MLFKSMCLCRNIIMVASTKMKVDTKLAKSEGFIFCFNSYQPRNSRNIYEYRMQRITIFVRTFWCKNFKNFFLFLLSPLPHRIVTGVS